MSDEHDGEPGANSGGGHGFHFRGDFAADVLRDLGSIKNE